MEPLQSPAWTYQVQRSGPWWHLALWCPACGSLVEEMYDTRVEAQRAAPDGCAIFERAHRCPAGRLWF